MEMKETLFPSFPRLRFEFVKMLKRPLLYLALLGAAALWISCTSPTPTPAPTREPSPATQPTPTIATAVDNCTSCHRDKATLEKLAVKNVQKSEEAQGEG